MDLSADDEVDAEQAQLEYAATNTICYDNLIKFHDTRSSGDRAMVSAILAHREQLPEISTFALRVDLGGRT